MRAEALPVDTVDCSDTELAVTLEDGRRISVPLWWLPRLLEATPAQRAAWRVMPFGDAVEWHEIDEHVSVKGLLRGKAAPDAKPPGTELCAAGFALPCQSCDKPPPTISGARTRA
jgi:Protein of unknown function (DUF2442)